jgi:hypothetical protein
MIYKFKNRLFVPNGFKIIFYKNKHLKLYLSLFPSFELKIGAPFKHKLFENKNAEKIKKSVCKFLENSQKRLSLSYKS